MFYSSISSVMSDDKSLLKLFKQTKKDENF